MGVMEGVGEMVRVVLAVLEGVAPRDKVDVGEDEAAGERKVAHHRDTEPSAPAAEAAPPG